MLQEAIDVFHTMLQKEGDHLITDAYIPKDGEYRLIIMDDDQWEMKDPINITFNKKNRRSGSKRSRKLCIDPGT